MWVALQYDERCRRWLPAAKFSRVYHKRGHVLSAITQSKWRWRVVRDEPNLIEYELVYNIRNPITGRPEQIVSPTRITFVDISTAIQTRMVATAPEQRSTIPIAGHMNQPSSTSIG